MNNNPDQPPKTKVELTGELRNAWLRQLHHYQKNLLNSCLSYLSSERRDKLSPFIIFFRNERLWGYWDSKSNTIGLNLKMIETCPWTTVLGVFAHEMAHMLTDKLEHYNYINEDPHGPTFKSFCRKLKIHAVFARASIDEITTLKPPSPYGPQKETEPHPILAKVQKLLALSSSPQPAEAEAALEAAGRLMAKHNLELPKEEKLDSFDNFERWVLPLNTSRMSYKISVIGQILANHFFIKPIFVHIYNHLEDKMEMTMEIVGRPVNLAMAKHVFYFLQERTETLWNYHKPLARAQGEKGRGAKNVFIGSLLDSFRKKLQLAEQQTQIKEGIASSAVILNKDAGLKAFFDHCFPRIKTTTSHGSSSRAPFSRQAGTKAGEELTIYSPLDQENDSSVKGFLE